MADQLAKEGREKEQPPSHLSYREVKTLIHNKKKAIFPCKTGGYNPNQDALIELPRHQQTIIFCLRTGHCRLNSHLKRIGVKDLRSMPLWRGGPNTRTLPTVRLTPSASKAADMAHLRVPQNQALGVCREFVPDIQVCGTGGRDCLLVGCLTSQQQASVSQGRICSDNFTCCHTEIEVADQTFYLTQSQHTDTGPTSPSADPITPGRVATGVPMFKSLV